MPKQNRGCLEDCLRATMGHCGHGHYNLLLSDGEYRLKLMSSNLENARTQASIVRSSLGDNQLAKDFQRIIHALELAYCVLTNPRELLIYPCADLVHQILYARADIAMAHERLKVFTEVVKKAKLTDVAAELNRQCVEYGHEVKVSAS